MIRDGCPIDQQVTFANLLFLLITNHVSSSCLIRYWGDEAKSTGKDDAATSLQSLLAKIEERRKRQNPPDLPQTKTTAEVKPIEIQSDEPPSKKQTTKSLTTKVTEQSVEAVVPTSGSKNDDFTIISSIEFKKNQKVFFECSFSLI